MGGMFGGLGTPSASHNKLPNEFSFGFHFRLLPFFVEGALDELCLHALHADHMSCTEATMCLQHIKYIPVGHKGTL